MVVLAQEEARALRHNYIGTEHILLGLLREEEGLAARVLESLDITVERVRAQVVRIVGSGEEVTSGQIPFTPRAKKVLELALREALRLGHNYIDPEHILLALTRVNESVAARILLDFGADSGKIRGEVVRNASPPVPGRVAAEAPTHPEVPDVRIRVGHSPQVRRLLMAAGARALDDGRTEIEIRDVLIAFARAPTAAALLADLGIDEHTIRAAIRRHDRPADPPEASATG